jgi:hypothetical protein
LQHLVFEGGGSFLLLTGSATNNLYLIYSPWKWGFLPMWHNGQYLTISDKEFTSRKTLPSDTVDEIKPRHLQCSILFILLISVKQKLGLYVLFIVYITKALHQNIIKNNIHIKMHL